MSVKRKAQFFFSPIFFLLGLFLNQTPPLCPFPDLPQGNVKPCWRCSCTTRSGERLGAGERGGGGQKSGENGLDAPQANVVKRCRQSRNPQGRTLRSSL